MAEKSAMKLTRDQQAMLEVFGQHMQAETVTLDVDAALATMTETPYVNHVPVMTGGYGREEVRRFYAGSLIGQFMPPDAEITTISRTVGHDRIVEEGVAAFTHTMAMPWMLPAVAPTGKRVEVAVVVIVQFERGKIAHEHIYWDQASVLVQLGLLDPAGLPVTGAASARKVLDPALVTGDTPS